MNDSRFIKSIRLRNLLSFGPDNEEFELKSLNVLIGPNASGKSNFIEAIDLLRATTRDINEPCRQGGGIREWLWKGNREEGIISIDVIITNRPEKKVSFINYHIDLNIIDEAFFVYEEVIKPEKKGGNVNFFYKNITDKAEWIITRGFKYNVEELMPEDDFDIHQSILSQFKSFRDYPEITRLGRNLNKIKIYRNIDVTKKSVSRLPQQTDLPSDFLSEDFNNLPLVINELESKKETQDLVVDKLRILYDDVDRIITKIVGGPIQIFIQEKGLNDLIPASRLSDGTLRYLCLLTILCHPEPPPLICIEEPEIGLHPDIMPTIAELLIEASKRTQLIVTTHSDALVSALSETPESVVVCEHDDDGTHMRRLEKEKLKGWLDKYTLGDLWEMGEIGGTRW